ncbi:MAG: hypothetical protein NT124_02050 [Candidatus Dependentiae bacterium]|nr:hypothetical protein [Candidatus Dependentiae bacterium]
MTENGLYDIEGMWHQPWWQSKECSILIYVIISISLFLVLVAVIRWYILRKKAHVLMPWEQALQDMYAIKSINYKDIGGDRDRDTRSDQEIQDLHVLFYVEISKILKKYLQARYAFAVCNSTDRETVAYLQAIDFNKEITGMIAEVFNGGQYVKFAGQKAVKENRERHFDMGITIIQKTIPVTLK